MSLLLKLSIHRVIKSSPLLDCVKKLKRIGRDEMFHAAFCVVVGCNVRIDSGPQSTIFNGQLETGNRKQEAGGKQLEAWSMKLEVWSLELEASRFGRTIFCCFRVLIFVAVLFVIFLAHWRVSARKDYRNNQLAKQNKTTTKTTEKREPKKKEKKRNCFKNNSSSSSSSSNNNSNNNNNKNRSRFLFRVWRRVTADAVGLHPGVNQLRRRGSFESIQVQSDSR